MRRLSILDGGLDDADVVGDVAVDGEKVRQPIEIVVKEKRAEGKRASGYAGDSGGWSIVGEQAGAIVVIERHAFVGEIADHHALPAGVVVVGRVGSHAGAGGAGVAVSQSSGNANVGKGSVAVVVVE